MTRAENGNVALTGEIDLLGRGGEFAAGAGLRRKRRMRRATTRSPA